MANTIGTTAQKMSSMARYQRKLMRSMVSNGISEMKVTTDKTIYNPNSSQSSRTDGSATTGQSYTASDYVLSADTLTVDRRAISAERIDPMDEMQSGDAIFADRYETQAYAVKTSIDQYVLNLPVSFSGVTDLDDSNLGSGSSGDPFDMTSSNVDTVSGKITEQLLFQNAEMDRGTFIVLSPVGVNNVASFQQASGYSTADAALSNGFVKGVAPIAGLDVYVSNNLTHSVVLTIGTNPTANDYVELQLPEGNVRFTFVATPTAAGDIDIGGSASATRGFLTNAINAGSGAGTDYIELSTENRRILNNAGVSASHSTTITITAKSSLRAVKSLTAGGDGFGAVGYHAIAGIYNSITAAMFPTPLVEKKPVAGVMATELVTSQVYNATIWTQMAKQVVDVYLK